ncbi:putative nucleoside-diphosphate-sugar epimerase [Xylariaceae sp. FL0662B]|nr:putative nucleoside-diphosphate-sugar epimerase [Xylariaceae sp. FL0662B]
MKLIVAGATGFVAKEVIKQSLSRNDITSVVALARKPVPVPEKLEDGADPSKLRSVIVKDYNDYPDEVNKEFAGASACIWTVAITPVRSKAYDFDEVKRICQTCTLSGLQAMYDAGVSKPFHFLYMSGATAERDQTKKPWYMGDYTLMRGETESKVLALAAELKSVKACVIKPGLIVAPGEIMKSVMSRMMRWTINAPGINVVDLATIMLDRAVNGIERDTLTAHDLDAIENPRK